MKRVSQSPTDPAFVQDPYPFYARARETGPIVYWKDYDLPVATTMRAVMAVLKDRRFGREVPSDFAKASPDHLADFYAVEAHSMLELEPPRHKRLRSLVLRAFTSRRINALGPEIESLCLGLIGGFPGEPFDLLNAYAQKVPIVVITRLLGVPETMGDQLLNWSHAMVGMYQAGRTRDDEDKAAGASREFSEFMRSYVDERRTSPADDLITELIAAEEAGDRLSTDELITTCILLLNAGHEATVHAIGNAVKLMLEHDVCEVDDRLIEEALRFDPPLHLFTRYAYEDVELCGHAFQRGDEVGCLLASANRDPGFATDPENFDPTRPVRQNASFGAGIHFCVGAPLARLEMRIALTSLFQNCPDLRLTEHALYSDSYHFHGLNRLMVETGAV